MEKIDTQTFWSRLKGTRKVLDSVLADDVVQLTRVHLEDVEISNVVFIAAHFNNSTFDGLTFTDCSFETLTFDRTTFERPLMFKNCQIKTCNFRKGVTARAIHIVEDSKVDKIEFNGGTINELQFSKVVIGELVAHDLTGRSLIISDSKAFRNIYIGGSFSQCTLQAVGCEEAEFHFASESPNMANVVPLRLENTVCTGRIKFSSTAPTTITCIGGSYPEWTVEEQNLHIVTIEGTSIAGFRLGAGISKLISHDGAKRSEIGNLDLAKIPDVNLYNCTIQNLILNYMNRNGNLQFTNVIVSNFLEIINSRIDGAKFNNVSLANCDFTLRESTITSSSFVNVRWPRHYRINEEIIEGIQHTDFLWVIRESYRQLKVVSDQQNNAIEGREFKKQEIRVYWKIVHTETWGNGFKKWWRHFGDWLILGSDKLFSDFGQSIGRPLFALLFVDLLLFNRLVWLYDVGVTPSWSHASWKGFWNGLGLYLNFLNPIHAFQFNGVSVMGVTDFLMRILSAYFIFHFLRATRKFNF
jgi:uncharacterized protein YjbI with pentapeptide repeats